MSTETEYDWMRIDNYGVKWTPGNNGTGKRKWFVWRYDAAGHMIWHEDKNGNARRYSMEGAHRTARQLNAASVHNIDVFRSGGGSDGPARYLPACLECTWRGDVTEDYSAALTEATEHRLTAAPLAR